MTFNSKVQQNPISGTISAESLFQDFVYLTLIDAGSDGFRLKDQSGNIVTIPTGIPVNIEAPPGRLCSYIAVKAPVIGTLNVSYICDIEVKDIIDDEMKYLQVINLGAGVDTDIVTPLTSEPYNLEFIDSTGKVITKDLGDPVLTLTGGVYHVSVYSTDVLTNVKLKIIY